METQQFRANKAVGFHVPSAIHDHSFPLMQATSTEQEQCSTEAFFQVIPQALSWPNKSLMKRAEGELSVGGLCSNQMPTVTRKVPRSQETDCCRNTYLEEPIKPHTPLTVLLQHPIVRWTEAQGCVCNSSGLTTTCRKVHNKMTCHIRYSAFGSIHPE